MSPSTQAARFKLFIVDDSPIIVNRLTDLVGELKNITVVGNAHNYSNALQSIKELKPDVIILDIHLKDDAPNANGLDLLAILHKEYAAMIIIMLTNLASSQYIDRCIELGADYFLDKTLDFDKIPDILRKLYGSK